MQALIVFLLVFTVIVSIHEFGHFYFARKAGILVRELPLGWGLSSSAIRERTGSSIPFE